MLIMHEKTCVIIILVYLPVSNQKPTKNTNKTFKYHFPFTGFLQTKWLQR